VTSIRLSPIAHVLLASGALAVLALAGWQSSAFLQTAALPAGNEESAEVADIAFEHQSPLSAVIRMSVLDGQALIEISHDGNEAVSVSVPAHWKRSEIRNAPLESVTAEPIALGFRRWSFPARSSVTFFSSTAPAALLIHNPTAVQLKVQAVRVNLANETVEQDIALIQKDSTKIW